MAALACAVDDKGSRLHKLKLCLAYHVCCVRCKRRVQGNEVCVEEVSDHVIGLLLAWNRRIPLFDNSVKTSGWGSLALNMPILRLRGKKLGIVGFGRIGRAVCQKAQAFGFEVLAYDPYVPAEAISEIGARAVDMETLLKESDFVTITLSSFRRG